jgi:RNA polymerase sigma factor (TIGR02999 family)
MSDVTRILYAIEGGDAKAAAELLPLVYDQLRKTAQQRMSGERADHSLDATALVHEAYLKLVGDDAAGLQWANRAHFFAAAAEAMRRILVDHARAHGRLKRGGGQARLSLTVATLGAEENPQEIVALDDALRRLEKQDERMARIVSLRFFAGLSVEETARAMDVSPRTVKREWATARAWLYRELRDNAE